MMKVRDHPLDKYQCDCYVKLGLLALSIPVYVSVFIQGMFSPYLTNLTSIPQDHKAVSLLVIFIVLPMFSTN